MCFDVVVEEKKSLAVIEVDSNPTLLYSCFAGKVGIFPVGDTVFMSEVSFD